MGCLRRETKYKPVDQSADVVWIVLGSIFLGSSGIHPNLSTTHEMLPRTGTARRKRTLGIRGLTREAYVSC
jgi:hypothetical protein